MPHPSFDPELALDYLDGRRDAGPLLREAAALRDAGHGRVVTYSRKVFIPLTTLCRDKCTYCTFAKPPGAGGEFMEPEEVLAVALAGERRGCTEALFTLGDSPESRWAAATSFLEGSGYSSTLDYLVAMTSMVVEETSLFPHSNPGIMTEQQVGQLRPSNPSMGLMLENISSRLMEPGMPHYQCPDKDPDRRMGTIRVAAAQRVPFTTGILVGIGENTREIVDSLLALKDVSDDHGHIQEVIVQNFRAKDDTPMRRNAEPVPAYFSRVVAVARWLFGPTMNIQVPPNLTERYEDHLAAGINDWGGVSPVTIDWVNPEQPWPHLEELADRTRNAGFELRPRLPVYPTHISETWIDPGLLPRVERAVDDDGFAVLEMEVPS